LVGAGAGAGDVVPPDGAGAGADVVGLVVVRCVGAVLVVVGAVVEPDVVRPVLGDVEPFCVVPGGAGRPAGAAAGVGVCTATSWGAGGSETAGPTDEDGGATGALPPLGAAVALLPDPKSRPPGT
jgi:hypothetical protein